MAGPGFYSDLSIVTNVNDALNAATASATQSANSAAQAATTLATTISTGAQIISDAGVQRDLANTARVQAEAALAATNTSRDAAAASKAAAKLSEDIAAGYAAASGGSVGAGFIAGKARQVLKVKPDESGVEWGNQFEVGEGFRTLRNTPPFNFVFLDGTALSTAMYPDLQALIGYILDANPATSYGLQVANVSGASLRNSVYFNGSFYVVNPNSVLTLARLSNTALTAGYAMTLNPPPTGNAYIQGIAAGGGNLVFTTADSANGQYYIYYGTNGISWTRATLPGIYITGLGGVVFVNGNFYAFATNNSSVFVFRSTDKGVTWTLTSTFAGNQLAYYQAVNIGNTLYVVSKENSAALRSTDNGVTWTVPTTPPQGNMLSVVKMTDGTVLASSNQNNCIIYTTTDFLTWTANTKYIIGTVNGQPATDMRIVKLDAAFGNLTVHANRYVNGAYWYCATTTDGVTWKPILFQAVQAGVSDMYISQDNNQIMRVYTNGSTQTSMDFTAGGLMSYPGTTSFVTPVESVSVGIGKLRTVVRAK